jgi:hypothetical protein
MERVFYLFFVIILFSCSKIVEFEGKWQSTGQDSSFCWVIRNDSLYTTTNAGGLTNGVKIRSFKKYNKDYYTLDIGVNKPYNVFYLKQRNDTLYVYEEWIDSLKFERETKIFKRIDVNTIIKNE